MHVNRMMKDADPRVYGPLPGNLTVGVCAINEVIETRAVGFVNEMAHHPRPATTMNAFAYKLAINEAYGPWHKSCPLDYLESAGEGCAVSLVRHDR